MKRVRVGDVTQFVVVCALMWAAAHGASAADPSGPANAAGAPLGLGGSYLVGFVAAALVFGARLAMGIRDDHLAENGK